MAARSLAGMPSPQPSVMTVRPVRPQFTSGTTKPSSCAVFSANSLAEALSRRRSSSPITVCSKCSTTSVGRRRRVDGNSISITRAEKWKASMSVRKARSMPGRRTLTATACPVSARRCLVDLRDRGGCDGFRKLGKHRVDLDPKLFLDHAARHVLFERRQFVLQVLQLVGQFRAHHVRTGRQDLTELNIGRTQRGDGAGDGGQSGVALFAQPREGPADHMGGDADGCRCAHRVQHDAHCAGSLEGRAGSDQAPDVVRATHLRFSTPNAGPRCPSTGCDISRFRTRPRGSYGRRFPDRGTCGSIPPDTDSCRSHRQSVCPCAGSR